MKMTMVQVQLVNQEAPVGVEQGQAQVQGPVNDAVERDHALVDNAAALADAPAAVHNERERADVPIGVRGTLAGQPTNV
jgi:hypothetical protein